MVVDESCLANKRLARLGMCRHPGPRPSRYISHLFAFQTVPLVPLISMVSPFLSLECQKPEVLAEEMGKSDNFKPLTA